MRSKQSIDTADLVIIVLDATSPLDDEERELLKITEDKKKIIIINKTDVENNIASTLSQELSQYLPIEISIKTNTGLEVLTNRIKELYNLGKIGQNENTIVTNLRHVEALERAKSSLASCISSINDGMPSDIASIDINQAIDALGEITGAVVSEDIVSAIFHSFCVGK